MDVFENKYWSVADTMILPLTGIPKDIGFTINSYMFWKDFTIENNQLIVQFSAEEEGIEEFLKNKIYPILDKNGYLMESYDVGDRMIFILDLTEWRKDIKCCIDAKYSFLSKNAKRLIEDYHKYEKIKVPLHIWVALYPNNTAVLFEQMTGIEYCAEEYGLDLELLQEVGELGIKYDKFSETLLTNVEELCQPGVIIEEV